MSIKSKLVSEISKDMEKLSESDVSTCINLILEKMIKHLSEKGRIEIRNFGTFNLHYKPSRKAHNPKTGEKLMTKPKYVVHFKPGKIMKEKINS